MSDNMQAALAMLAATYGTNPLPDSAEPIVTVLPAKAVKPKKEKKSKVSVEVAPKTLTSAVLPSNMPVVGSLTATEFLLAMRAVGKRTVEATNDVTGEVYQKPIYDNSLVREDSIRAIAGFIGYDAAGDFGAQDVAARAEAQRQIRGGVQPAAAHRRGGASVAATVVGYIAGNPDHAAKQRADLEGRERLAADAMAEHLRNASDPKFVREPGMPEPEVLAAIEEERLRVIRKDLGKL